MLYGYITFDQIAEIFKYSFLIFGYYHFMMFFYDRREHWFFLSGFTFLSVFSIFWLIFFIPTIIVKLGVIL